MIKLIAERYGDGERLVKKNLSKKYISRLNVHNLKRKLN